MSDESQHTDGVDADIARIEAMRDAGTVTTQEAERLIAVLREISDAEADIAAIDAAPASPPPPPPRAPSTERDEATTTSSHASHWVAVSLLAGDVTIRSGDVAEPQLGGDAEHVVLERDGEGWRVRDTRSGFFERAGQFGSTDVDLVVPRTMGVRLDVKAGDVRVREVVAVTGKMLAGDLTIDGAEALDVQKSAGDLVARVRLRHGRHRIRASAGDIDVTLLEGSDVTVRAKVTLGDVRGAASFSRVRTGMGGAIEGTVGAGRAALDVRLSAGDVRLRKEDADG